MNICLIIKNFFYYSLLFIAIWELLTWVILIYLSYHPAGSSYLQILWLVLYASLMITFAPMLILTGIGYFIYKSFQEITHSKHLSMKCINFPGLLFILAFVCIGLFYINSSHMSSISSDIRDFQFNRNISQYEGMVKSIHMGEINESPDHNGLMVPNGFPADRIFLSNFKDKGNQVAQVIQFCTFGRIPELRGGYLYLSDDKSIGLINDWKIRKMKPHWYAYSE